VSSKHAAPIFVGNLFVWLAATVLVEAVTILFAATARAIVTLVVTKSALPVILAVTRMESRCYVKTASPNKKHHIHHG